ncbi:MAG: hypothetical protein SGILL_006002, partial [Bacillariaceae sp.]
NKLCSMTVSNDNDGNSDNKKSSTADEIAFRKRGIDECLQWLSSLAAASATSDNTSNNNGNNNETETTYVSELLSKVQFEPDNDSGEESDGIGVFGKQQQKSSVSQPGDVLISIPAQAGLTLDHELFQESVAIQNFVTECRTSLEALIAKDAPNVSPHDRYSKVQGRVLLKNYLLLTFVITLMLREDEEEENDESAMSSPLQQDISKACDFWSSFFHTQPQNWSHLPLFWEDDDLKRIQGTSFHSLTVRFQTEMKQVYEDVFLPSFCKHHDDDDDDDEKSTTTETASLYAKYRLALAIVNSHSHSRQPSDKEAFDLASQGLLRLDLNKNTKQPFVEPIPIIFPIIDLINGMRMQNDCNAELIYSPSDFSYQVVATKAIQAGAEIFLCYGENSLSNLDFFVKFGFIPLAPDGAPVLVKGDFVTLPLGPRLRPATSGKNVPKVDQLRWMELSKHGLGKDRIVEPVHYFQRPFYVNGNIDAVRQLRNSSAFSPHSVAIPQIDKLEMYVMTMLANKTALKKLSEGKMPPPPVLQPWEPGQRMLEILDYSLDGPSSSLATSTTIEDLQVRDTNNYRRVLAAQARVVEREVLLLWRHAIASHHRLYSSDAANVERLPKSNASCCVTCRTSLHIQPCPNDCGAVSHCSDACREYDWTTGQHSRICALFAAKNKKTQPKTE